MIYYKNERIIVDGKVYIPATDVLHEEFNGLLSNVIANQEGKRYKAYYSEQHLDQNKWDEPLYIVEMLEIEQA